MWQLSPRSTHELLATAHRLSRRQLSWMISEKRVLSRTLQIETIQGEWLYCVVLGRNKVRWWLKLLSLLYKRLNLVLDFAA